MSTLCLCMIVRNESQVIARALNSVKPLLNYWVIIDTGSTDGTQEIIKKTMEGIPGELHESPWVNFAVNRTETLEKARGKAKYAFVMDADEIAVYAPDFSAKELKDDCTVITADYRGMVFDTLRFFNNDQPWRYEGVVHNYPTVAVPFTQGRLAPERLRVVHFHDGSRASDPKKTWRDVGILTNALVETPDSARYVFYLAQSYKECGEFDLSIHFYSKRVSMGGWPEEQWYAAYQVASLKCQRGDPYEQILKAYLDAYEMRPWRLEPLYELCFYLRRVNKINLCYFFGKLGMSIPFPSNDVLFIHKDMYDHLLLDEIGIAAYYTGRFQEAYDICERLLNEGKLPASEIERIKRNREFAAEKLRQPPQQTQ